MQEHDTIPSNEMPAPNAVPVINTERTYMAVPASEAMNRNNNTYGKDSGTGLACLEGLVWAQSLGLLCAAKTPELLTAAAGDFLATTALTPLIAACYTYEKSKNYHNQTPEEQIKTNRFNAVASCAAGSLNCISATAGTTMLMGGCNPIATSALAASTVASVAGCLIPYAVGEYSKRLHSEAVPVAQASITIEPVATTVEVLGQEPGVRSRSNSYVERFEQRDSEMTRY